MKRAKKGPDCEIRTLFSITCAKSAVIIRLTSHGERKGSRMGYAAARRRNGDRVSPGRSVSGHRQGEVRRSRTRRGNRRRTEASCDAGRYSGCGQRDWSAKAAGDSCRYDRIPALSLIQISRSGRDGYGERPGYGRSYGQRNGRSVRDSATCAGYGYRVGSSRGG